MSVHYYIWRVEARLEMRRRASEKNQKDAQPIGTGKLPKAIRATLPHSQVYRNFASLPASIREHYRSAGVLPFARSKSNGRMYVLLGDELDSRTFLPTGFHLFGGKRDFNTDQCCTWTAAREFFEESGGQGFARKDGSETLNKDDELVQQWSLMLAESTCAPVAWNWSGLFVLFALRLPEIVDVCVTWTTRDVLFAQRSARGDEKPRDFSNDPNSEKHAFVWVDALDLMRALADPRVLVRRLDGNTTVECALPLHRYLRQLMSSPSARDAFAVHFAVTL
jgi:hypothetical protein